MDTKQKIVFFDKLTYIYLELPKFTKTITQIETRFEKWLYVLKNLSKLDRLPEKLKEKIFEKLFKIAEIAKFSQAQLIRYEDSLKEYRDMFSVMSTQRNKGRKEGIKEGENKKALAIAKKLLKKNVPVKDISEITELSISEINKIKK